MQRTSAAYEFPGIYQILNLRNGKRYVGQAQNIAGRIHEHKRKRNGKTGRSRFYNAVKKYGWDVFAWSVLERVSDPATLNARESFWIRTLGVCDETKGYNICSEGGTTRGWRHSLQAKRKMSAANRRRTGRKNPFFGKHHSEQVKAYIGAINAARIRTPEEKAKLKRARAINGAGRPLRPVDQIDPKTNEVVKTWPSIGEACRTLRISIGSLVGCCQQRYGRRSAQGWQWRYNSRRSSKIVASSAD